MKVLSIMTLDPARNGPPAQDEIDAMERLIDAVAWTNRFLEVIGDGVTCYVREVVSPPV